MEGYFSRVYHGVTRPLGKAVGDLYPDLPYALLRRLFKQRDVFVNGARAGEAQPLTDGDTVHLFLTPSYIRIRVVYRDDDLLVLYKPKGIASDGQYSFEGLSRFVFGDNLRLLHRLDTNTDGLLMFALNDVAYEILYRYNSEHLITKYYVAEVYGQVKREVVLDGYLAKDVEAGRVRIYHEPHEGAQYVKCKVTPVDMYEAYTVVHVKLRGGKTHQIRAQLADWGHFILGDTKYGDDRINRRFGKEKQQLTAFKLVFPLLDDLPALNGKVITLVSNRGASET